MQGERTTEPSQASAAEAATRLKDALERHRRGDLPGAEQGYRDVLAIAPRHFDAMHLLGVVATQRGRPHEAVRWIGEALALNRGLPAAHSNLGLALEKSGRLAEAHEAYSRALQLNPEHLPALCNRAHVLLRLRRPADALADCDRALALRHDDPDALVNRALALRDLDRPQEALATLDRALALRRDDVRALYHRGNLLLQLDRCAEAVTSYDEALARSPAHVPALNNRGLALLQLGLPGEALASFDGALALEPASAQLLNNRGNALCAQGRRGDALAAYDAALAVAPDFADALVNRAGVLRALRRLPEALACCEQVLAARPDHLAALNNRGSVLRDLGRPQEALASYERALALDPDAPQTLHNCANALQAMQHHAEAAAHFARLVAVAPDFDFALGSLLECRRYGCDWTDSSALETRILDAVARGRKAIAPFALLAVSSSAPAQRRCAQIYMSHRHPPSEQPLWRGERYEHERIRVAYLSADLREHPVAQLMAEVFERHDRRRLETYAVSFGSPAASPMRQRLLAAFDHFLDVQHESDEAVAARLREHEIDIAVDLNGITAEARSGILARRPAPVQVNYLGYPGTMGAPYIDYVVADRYVIPEPARAHYTERVACLPEVFQATAAARAAGTAPHREALGLPAKAFVYCCLNASYKIAPPQFALWLRVLRRVSGSVLWLLGGSESIEGNLRRAAVAGGVAAERLVFAPRVDYAAHLARLPAADLFLDTLPFNGGATVSDALWAGLPVLTRSGEAFAARMAGSLLIAARMPELIAVDEEDYEARAVSLGAAPQHLAALRSRLAASRNEAPLFDCARFTRHLEAAYETMRQRARRGEPPQDFAVAPLPP